MNLKDAVRKAEYIGESLNPRDTITIINEDFGTTITFIVGDPGTSIYDATETFSLREICSDRWIVLNKEKLQ